MGNLRVGFGFDLHRLAAGRRLILGGIEIDHPLGALAHSDGDVALHALGDALLGAAGMGDLGDLFPDSDPAHRNRAGAEFLSTILGRLAARGLGVRQADLTLLLEEPKLGPRKAEIRGNVARLLGLPEDRVGMKAKTFEGLGPIGEGRAVAAYAVALVEETR